jgi:hypothetical protein
MADETTSKIIARIAGLTTFASEFAGAALISYGAEQICRPIGFIVAGAFLLGAAFLAELKDSR